jgi:hypothetical protein
MNHFFDCKSYHPARFSSQEYVFYAIPKNTAAAAWAFEMCNVLILNWALFKTGISARHSYCLGVANRLFELAAQEQKAWKADNGLQLIVADGQAFADQCLKSLYLRLHKARNNTVPKDMTAYEDGKKDSKKINVRGKRLE